LNTTRDGTSKSNTTDTTYSSFTNISISSGSPTHEISWIFLRQMTTNEPTHGSTSAEMPILAGTGSGSGSASGVLYDQNAMSGTGNGVGSAAAVITNPAVYSNPTTLTVVVNGVMIPNGCIDYTSIQGQDNINKRSTFDFTIIDITGTMGPYKAGMQVSVIDANSNLIFSGVILPPVTPTFINERQPSLYHKISCGDWHTIADGRVIVEAYSSTTTDQIFIDLFNKYLAPEGYTLGTVSAGPSITQLVFNYRYLSEAYDTLTTLATAVKNPMIWYITYGQVVNMVALSANPAPFTLVPSLCMGASLPSLDDGTANYRNVEYIKGGTDITTPQTEYKVGDGQATSWTLGYAVEKIISIKLNGVTQSVGDKSNSPIHSASYYYAVGDPIIVQDSNIAALTPSQILQIIYTGRYPIVAPVSDTLAIAARKALTGGTGHVEHVTTDTTIKTSADAIQLGQAYVNEYDGTAQKFQFTTTNPGLMAGQLLPVQFPPFAQYGLSNVQMLIETVNLSVVNNIVNGVAMSRIYYACVAVIGPVDDTWTAFFKKTLKKNVADLTSGNSDTMLTLAQPFSDGYAMTDNLATPTVLQGFIVYNFSSGQAQVIPTQSNLASAKVIIL